MKPILLPFILLLPLVASAQEHPAVSAQANTVYTGADGKFEAPPDTAVLSLNLAGQADTARAAYDLTSKQAEQTRQILRNNGIDPKEAQVGYYSTQPVYDYKNPKRKLIGYHVTTTVSVKLKDFTKVGPITQQLADGDVGESQSLTYTLEKMDDAKSKAVEDAYRRARANAESVARAAGRSVGELSYASVDTFENIRPIPMPRVMGAMKMEAAAAPPTEEFTPQTISITAHVNALFELK
jgi:uncharacterized protein